MQASELANNVEFWVKLEYDRNLLEREKAIAVINFLDPNLTLDEILNVLGKTVEYLEISTARRECPLDHRIVFRVRSIFQLIQTWKYVNFCPPVLMNRFHKNFGSC